jgi:hypothetical protein
VNAADACPARAWMEVPDGLAAFGEQGQAAVA